MRPLGLYVHWPYCARICPYCDFTVAKNREVDEVPWARSLTEDLRRFADMVEQRPLTSVYFGGGTPSLMPVSVAEAVLEEARAQFDFKDGCELTIEANPDDRRRFADLASVGFRRLSLGVQSFDDAELAFLGRNHDGREARLAIENARATFDEVSLDFIYALPDQTLSSWQAALGAILSAGADHLSLYQLTIEHNTAFGRSAARGTLVPMPDERMADFYEITQTLTSQGGYPAYEVSNHARVGAEAIHNALYWQDAEWIGIGPGAHGRLNTPQGRLATAGTPQIAQYLNLSVDQRYAVESLSAHDDILEALSGGLRPVRGLSISRLRGQADAVLKRAQPLIDDGLLTYRDGFLAASLQGRLVLDQLTLLLSEALSAAD